MDESAEQPSEGRVSRSSSGGSGIGGGVVAFAVLTVALLLFIVQNGDDAEVTWLFFDATQPQWVVILVTAVVSIVFGQLARWLWVRRRRRANA